MFTLDTNAIIYYLEGEEPATSKIEGLFRGEYTIYVSAITEVELLRFSRLSRKEIQQIATFLSLVTIVPVDSVIARLSGAVGRIYGVPLADSIIAATALLTGSEVVTRNVRDFNKVTGLRVKRI